MRDARAWLDPEQPDYHQAAELGPVALPLLEQLVRGDDPMLAAKAAYLASLIPDEDRPAVLAAAATSAEPTVRVAAAAGLRNLTEADAGELATTCCRRGHGAPQTDRAIDRQLLLRAMTERRVANTDPEEAIRGLAADSLEELAPPQPTLAQSASRGSPVGTTSATPARTVIPRVSSRAWRT